MVEPQPSKLMMRVRFPLPAPGPDEVKVKAHIAQSVEHFLGKEEVTGSNPVMSSRVLVAGSSFGAEHFVFQLPIGDAIDGEGKI